MHGGPGRGGAAMFRMSAFDSPGRSPSRAHAAHMRSALPCLYIYLYIYIYVLIKAIPNEQNLPPHYRSSARPSPTTMPPPRRQPIEDWIDRPRATPSVAGLHPPAFTQHPFAPHCVRPLPHSLTRASAD
eukprot:GHVU01146665.1.p3 GENE.GHVU01146665.1~~GHVU01146665.1.p3  ORF type:complete len:129 (+),score=7.08 GHVU01146665.1:467-853(+)